MTTARQIDPRARKAQALPHTPLTLPHASPHPHTRAPGASLARVRAARASCASCAMASACLLLAARSCWPLACSCSIMVHDHDARCPSMPQGAESRPPSRRSSCSKATCRTSRPLDADPWHAHDARIDLTGSAEVRTTLHRVSFVFPNPRAMGRSRTRSKPLETQRVAARDVQ